MQIDWLTTSAQIVNFLVLIVLLRKFLYRPILRNMQLRQQNIAGKLREAEEMQRNAERVAAQYRAKQMELENQRSKLLDDAKRETEEQRVRMIDQLREEIDQKRLTWYRSLAEEKNSTRADIKRLMGEKFMRLSRKALSDLAGANLESQITRRFLEQLDQLPEAEHQRLLNALAKHGWVKVLTHFDVSGEELTRIERRLAKVHPGLRVEFHNTAEIICGIVLETEGYSWPWTVDRYLDEFEELFAGLEGPIKSTDFA